MADRRMFSKKVTDSDAFIELSSAAQALYFHLNQAADDDGFNNQIQIAMMKSHASVDDLKVLMMKNFVIRFENGVIVIKHWRMHNTLRKDRYTPTSFQEELAQLSLKQNLSYTLEDGGGCQTVAKRLPQVRLGKDSIGKGNIYAHSDETEMSVPDLFDTFWKAYPRKIGKGNCQKWFKSHKPDADLVNQMVKAVEQQKASKQWQKDGGKYIPYPQTWLNGGRWEDELPPGETRETSYDIDQIEETGYFDPVEDI